MDLNYQQELPFSGPASASMPDRAEAILVTDLGLRIQFVNEEACDLLDIAKERAHGLLLGDLKGRSLSEKAWKVVHEAVELQQSRYFDDFLSETGAWYVYRVYPTPMVVTIAIREIRPDHIPVSGPNDNRLMSVLEGMPQGVIIADRETRKFLFVNKHLCTMLGYTSQELLGLSAFSLHPVSEHERLGKAFSQMMEGKNAFISDVPLLRKDGCTVPTNIHAIEFSLDGRPSICVVAIDISSQKRESQLQSTRVHILEMLSGGARLVDLLETITLSIEKISPGAVASVLLLEEDGVHVSQCIAPNMPRVFSESIIGLPIGPKAGSCGTAMYRRQPVFVEDILTDPLWEDYQGLTALIDLRACWSLPILDESGQPLGSFALYYRQPRNPESDELNLIQQAAHLTSLAVTKAHREKKLSQARERANESEQMLQIAQRVAKVGNWEMDHVNHVLTWSDQITEMIGFHPKPTDDPKQLLSGTIHPDDFPRVIANFVNHLTTREEYVSIHRILSPDGDIRYFQERCFTSFDPQGHPVRSVGVAADITDLKLAEEQLRNQFEELRQTKEALRESHQILELTLEGAVDAVITINAKQEVIFINRAALSMFGLEKESVLGQPVGVLFQPEYAQTHSGFVAQSLHNGATPINGHDREFEITRPDGGKFWGHITLSKIVNNGEVQYTAFIKDITDRKKAEELLAENEIRLLQIAAHGRTVAWEMDTQGMYTFISPVVKQLMGYEVEEMVGKMHYYDLHPEEGRQLFREIGEKSFAKKQPFTNFRNSVRCKNGDVLWVNTSGIPMLDADGNLKGYRGSATDITQQRQAENESHLLRQAIATSSLGMVLADATHPDTPLVFVNEAFEQLTGYSATEALGRNCRFLQGENPEASELAPIRNAIHGGGSGVSVVQNFRKDGTPFWNQLTISPIFDQNNQLTHFLGIQRDVTEQIRAEQARLRYALALETSNAQMDALLKAMPDAVWLKDTEGRYLKCNTRVESFFGYREEEIIGKTDADFFPDQATFFRANDLLAIEQGSSRTNEEWVEGADGKKELWEVTKIPILDSLGKLLGVLGVGHDITHRRLAETALRESEARYRIVADNTYNWEFWQAPDESFIYHSPSCEVITGYSPSELQQDFSLFLNQIHPDDRDRFGTHHSHANMRSRGTKKIQVRITNRAGETRHIEHICQAIFSDTGEYLGLRGTNVDITDQKLAELALARSEKQFRTLFEESPVSIIVHDKDTGEIVDANPAAWKEYGLESLEELQKQEFWLDSPYAFADALSLIQSAFTDGAHAFEWKSGRKKGSHFWEQVHLQPLMINGVERVLATSFNISARKEAEESLLKLSSDLQKRLKELSCLANISQLIETPDLSTPELLQAAANLLPLSVQFPGRACAAIQLDDKVFLSSHFLLSDNFLLEDLIVDNKRRGYIALYYSSNIPFLSEEDEMLKMIQRSLELYLANQQVQKSLSEKEERLRLALAAANQGLYDVDLRTGKNVVSPEYARMLGFEPEDDFLDSGPSGKYCIHPDDWPRVRQHYIDYAEGKQPEYRVEFRQKHKDGSWVWILSLGKIQEWDEAGRPVRMLGTHTDITALKEAEAALENSGKQYRNLFYQSPVGMIAITKDYEVKLVNNQFSKLTGYDFSEFTSIDQWWKTAYPDAKYRRKVISKWNALVAASENAQTFLRPMEVKIRCGDGQSRYFELGFMPMGEVNAVTFVDIHERKIVEEALRKSEATYRELIESSPVAKVVLDASERIVYVNNRFTQIAGYTQTEVPDMATLMQLLYPDPDQLADQVIVKNRVMDQVMLKKQQLDPIETTITSKDGQRITLEVGFFATGTFFIASLVDITLRKQAEEALRKSELRYRSILEQAPVGIVVHQGENITFTNPEGMRLLGASSENEIVGRSVKSFLHPEFASKGEVILQRLIRGDSNLFPVEVGLQKLDGGYIDVEVSASVIETKGEPAIQVIATDITERKRYTEAIEAQNKILKDINWTQSHVVRAPLATLMGLVTFLDTEDYTAFSYKDLLRLITEKANELDNIIRIISEKSFAVSALEMAAGITAELKNAPESISALEFMIVDDDMLIQKMQQAVVVKAGLHPEPKPFMNGKMALDHIVRYDAPGKAFFVLLDINMPQMNGWEFLDALQKHPPHARLEVVILTSSIDIADRIKAQKYPQVVEYMTKPINRLTVTELKDHPKLRSLWEGHS